MAFDGGDGGEGGDLDALLGGAAAGDGGAGGGAGGGGDGGASGDGGRPAADWLQSFSADPGDENAPSHRDWLASKGFKSLDDVARSYRETEKALRGSGRISVPGEGAKPEEIATFREAIGVPKEATAYEIKAPDGVKLNEPLNDALRASALKHGVPKGAFEGLVGDYIQAQLDETAAETQRQDGLAAAKLKEWGAGRDEKLAQVEAASRALGFTKADLGGLRNALGADRALDLLAKLGNGMAEDTLINGGKGRFGITSTEARAEMDRLKTDPEFQKKVMVKGSPERIRWDRLNEAAAAAA
ncbi:hypothetical protein [Sphingomonas jatrophae]|uniref:Uncharacterized protein n=1 Tax=Sphingomonas jatrophae TaxID=1166337 RepID=A0A1I6K5K9_9SPHN|nr:hypothetical protein [Sphingomonas jatrophae]SFR86533.1 hypothetical protein SAMN05192580_1354 [Sphingomonas jatrophae]